MKNNIRGNSLERSRNESVDCIIVLDETSSDPLKKRLDASSSLLSSVADSGANRLPFY